MESMTNGPRPNPGLADADYAAFAWSRFRRILGWMAMLSAVFIGLAIVLLQQAYGPLGWVAILAVIGGAGGSIMLAAVLMGLVFLSSGTGHDEAVDDLD